MKSVPLMEHLSSAEDIHVKIWKGLQNTDVDMRVFLD